MHIAYAPLVPGELVVGEFPKRSRIWVPRDGMPTGKGASWILTRPEKRHVAFMLDMHRLSFESALRNRIEKLPRGTRQKGYLVVWLRSVCNERINFALGYMDSSVIERNVRETPFDVCWPPDFDRHPQPKLKKPLPLSVVDP